MLEIINKKTGETIIFPTPDHNKPAPNIDVLFETTPLTDEQMKVYLEFKRNLKNLKDKNNKGHLVVVKDGFLGRQLSKKGFGEGDPRYISFRIFKKSNPEEVALYHLDISMGGIAVLYSSIAAGFRCKTFAQFALCFVVSVKR